MCGNGFEADARGVVIPHITADKTSPWISWTEIRYNHLGCIIGSIGVGLS